MRKEDKSTRLFREIFESAQKNEFKPRKGEGVDSESKKNNEKANKEERDEVMDKQPKETRRKGEIERPYDWNRTLIDLDFNDGPEPSDKWWERANANLHGFTSKMEEENSSAKEAGNQDYSKNEKIAKDMKDRSERRKEREKDVAQAGIRGHNLKWNTKRKHTSPLDEGMQRIRFSHKIFENENDVIQSVPKSFMTEGRRFIMTDATNTDYLMECRMDSLFEQPSLTIVGKYNPKTLEEELNKMKSLNESKKSVLPESDGMDYDDMRTLLDIARKF